LTNLKEYCNQLGSAIQHKITLKPTTRRKTYPRRTRNRWK